MKTIEMTSPPYSGESNSAVEYLSKEEINDDAFYKHDCGVQKQSVFGNGEGLAKRHDNYQKLYMDQRDCEDSKALFREYGPQNDNSGNGSQRSGENEMITALDFLMNYQQLPDEAKDAFNPFFDEWVKGEDKLLKKAGLIIQDCVKRMSKCDCGYVYNKMLMRILMCFDPMLENMNSCEILQEMFTIYVFCRILLHNKMKDCNQFRIVSQLMGEAGNMAGLKYVCIHTDHPGQHFTFGVVDPANAKATLFTLPVEEQNKTEMKDAVEKEKGTSLEKAAIDTLLQRYSAIKTVDTIKIEQQDSLCCGLIVIYLMNEDLEGKLEFENNKYKFCIRKHIDFLASMGFETPSYDYHKDLKSAIIELECSFMEWMRV
ncbi:MAG: hypothetical protein MHMPM18_001877 [Marteilia pararefringens]